MIVRGSLCTLRPWQLDDVAALPEVANDPDVVRYMNHRFPSPYTRADADAWIRTQLAEPQVQNWAIEVDGALAGGIGLTPGVLEHAGNVAIGYFIGKRFWGRGVASDALRALTAHALATLRPRRLWANVMAANAPSARVLEKAGYIREAVLARAIVDRAGTAHDELIFVFPQTAAELT
ncbi:MAG: GNAT family N-acetyltransferase [Candidatus Eremiobacteraeota bacterium]|nr:GNAT family N-acetyltransferase [Candidatus Eremiobacteraeota bacterium]